MTFPAWQMGATVEYANGFRAEVIHIDGEFAILRTHPDLRHEHDGDGFIVAQGDQREFSFENEADPICLRLDSAMKLLVEAREGEKLAAKVLRGPKKSRRG